MKIITLGPEGTFCHLTAKEAFPKASIHFADHLDQIFTLFATGKYDHALIPIENSISGFIDPTLANLIKTSGVVTGHVLRSISHHLAGFGDPGEASILFAHPHTYQQCREHIKELCPQAEVEYTASNAFSAKKLAEAKNKRYLAIVPELAAEIYNLPILTHDIEDIKDNSTRFLILSRKKKVGKHTALLLFSEIDETILQELLAEKEVSNLRVEKLKLKEMECPTYWVEYEGAEEAFGDYQTKVIGSYD